MHAGDCNSGLHTFEARNYSLRLIHHSEGFELEIRISSYVDKPWTQQRNIIVEFYVQFPGVRKVWQEVVHLLFSQWKTWGNGTVSIVD